MNVATQTCPTCQGSGVLTNNHTGEHQTCPRCGGDGEIEQRLKRIPYDFVFPRTNINAAAVPAPAPAVPIAVQTPKDMEFEWWDIVAISTGVFDVILEINAETLMNSLQPGNFTGIAVANWAGTAQLPAARRVPFILPRGTQVTLYLTDQSGASNVVQVAFRGFLLKKLKAVQPGGGQ
jgi:hypothetical protein